jgi:hypothetical protein
MRPLVCTSFGAAHTKREISIFNHSRVASSAPTPSTSLPAAKPANSCGGGDGAAEGHAPATLTQSRAKVGTSSHLTSKSSAAGPPLWLGPKTTHATQRRKATQCPALQPKGESDGESDERSRQSDVSAPNKVTDGSPWLGCEFRLEGTEGQTPQQRKQSNNDDNPFTPRSSFEFLVPAPTTLSIPHSTLSRLCLLPGSSSVPWFAN